MPFRAALFDVDGTLLDSNELHVQAWRRAFADFGIEVSAEALREQMGNGGDRVVKALCSPEQADRLGSQLIERHVEIFARDYLPGVKPFPGVRELFERLRSDGISIVLASSAQPPERDRHVEILGVADLLDGASDGHMAEHTKPAPDIFQAALGRLHGVAAAEAVAIGDSPYDAQAARRAGMHAIGVLSGGFSKHRLRQAGARLVYRDVSELLQRYQTTPFHPGDPTRMHALMSKMKPRATDMIRADHTRVLAAFHRYDIHAAPRVKRGLADAICLSLEIHAQLEDEIFYPAMRGQSDVVGQLVPQHEEMRRLIAGLRGSDPRDAQFDATLMELMRDVMHHVADEETILLPAAEASLGERLADLGAAMMKRRLELKAPRAGEMVRDMARAMPASTVLLATGALLAGVFAASRVFRRG